MAIYNTSWIHTNASEELNSGDPSGNRTRDLRNYPSAEDIPQKQAIVQWCIYYTLFLFGKVPLTGNYLQNLQKNFFVATLFSPLLRLSAKFRKDELIFHLFITLVTLSLISEPVHNSANISYKREELSILVKTILLTSAR